MSQVFASQLGLKIWKTNVEAQKIDGTTLETYGMVVSSFFMSDKDGRKRFFEKSFLLTDIKLDVVLRIFFLIMSNADIDFQAQNLQWRSYTIGDVLPTTGQIEIIGRKEFAVTVFDLEYEAFVVYVATFRVDLGDELYFSKRAKADKASTKIPSKYADFADVFSPKLAIEFRKHTRINNYAIELVDD